MISEKKRWMKGSKALFCALCVTVPTIAAQASETDKLEAQSSQIKVTLEGINQDLVDLAYQIDEVEDKLQETDNQIIQKKEQLSIAKASEVVQYRDMKDRIKFMYENNSDSWIEYICSAKSVSELLNNYDYVTTLSKYDRKRLDEFKELRLSIETQQEELEDEQKDYLELQRDLLYKQSELKEKAAQASTDLNDLMSQISSIRESEAKKAEEMKKRAEEKAAEEAAKKAAEEEAKKQQESGGSTTTSGGYIIPSGGLTPSKGVVYFNGHRETYYSQRVLPGGGLNIPGRHVASDGTIRDVDGYICVASPDYPRGTVILTSLGPGKVYDTGCDSGTVDLYTDW